MKHVDVLFLYEHVARELDVACAVKYYLREHHGLSVEIVQQPFAVPAAIGTLEPALVVLPFCYSASLKHYPFLLDWRDKIFVNAMWEQLYYPGNRSAKIPRGEFETQHVLHHAWSLDTLALLRDCSVPRENMFLNGHLAYTLYDPPYRAFFEDRSALARRFGLDPQKRWIFFPENYNWAFYEDWRLNDLSASGLDRQTMSEMAIFCRDSLAQVVGWCAEISTRSDVELIVRPRPSTPAQQFATAIDNLIPNRSARFHILKEGSVREWIMASDVVISSYSTTLIEAAIAGKPSFMLEPVPIPATLYAGWHAYLPHLKSNAEFQAACLAPTMADLPLGAWARRTMMAHGDSILNFANLLAKLQRGEIARPPVASRASILGTNSNSLVSWVTFEKRRLRERAQRTRMPTQWAALYEKDLLEPGQLAERVSRLGAVISNAPGYAPLTEPILEH